MSVKIENSLEELYLKYRNKISRHLENDSYFQYMFELIKSGENVLQQTNRVLHKNIDEKWLTVIEDTIPADSLLPRKMWCPLNWLGK